MESYTSAIEMTARKLNMEDDWDAIYIVSCIISFIYNVRQTFVLEDIANCLKPGYEWQTESSY